MANSLQKLSYEFGIIIFKHILEEISKLGATGWATVTWRLGNMLGAKLGATLGAMLGEQRNELGGWATW